MQLERTGTTVEVQACCASAAAGGGALMQAAVARALNSTAVYVAREYTVASAGALCVLLLYQVFHPFAFAQL